MRRIIRRAVQQATHRSARRATASRESSSSRWGGVSGAAARRPARSSGVLRLEEERFSETLERGLKLFDDLAAERGDHGRAGFTLAATYGFPLELTVELAEERGQAVDVDGLSRGDGATSRCFAAGGERGAAGGGFARAAGFETEFVGYDKTEVLTSSVPSRSSATGTSWRSSASRRSIRRGEARSRTSGPSSSTRAGTRAELVDAYRLGGPGAALPRRRVRRG